MHVLITSLSKKVPLVREVQKAPATYIGNGAGCRWRF